MHRGNPISLRAFNEILVKYAVAILAVVAAFYCLETIVARADAISMSRAFMAYLFVAHLCVPFLSSFELAAECVQVSLWQVTTCRACELPHTPSRVSATCCRASRMAWRTMSGK